MSTAPSPLAGRYELLHEIGRGGAASVHVARDTHLERQVAVKLLHPELAHALGHGRFLREIRIASGLRHPHIVPVLDFGETDGGLWYVMPYLEAGSLRARLDREGQLRMDTTLRWGAEIADALAFAHSQGYVHRDVKPENILLDGDHALLADFGIARGIARGIDAATRETLTSAGIAVGTPTYMSPEQASGSGEIDGRSDVYALGCVLYECLAGVPPFTGPTPQSIIAQRFAHAPHPVASYRDTVPAAVAELVESTLHLAPADRPTAAEACAVLRGESTGEPRVSGRRSGAGAAVRARPSLTGSRVAAMAGVALVAAAAAGSAMWTSRPALDDGKVVIYPLVNGGANAAGISSLLGVALDGVPSLRWVEGEQLLTERSARPGTAHELQLDAARNAGAGHFIDGSVISTGDSVRVVMRLVDTGDDSVVARAGAAAAGGSDAVPALALRAIGLLLPQLLTPGSQWDVRALSERNPAAIAAFLVGEREFRSSRYDEALARYQEALALDSNLAIAALKAARSARSLFREEDARRFVRMALARDSLLPGANLHFARGLAGLYAHDSDTALAEFDRALTLDPEWGEVHAAVGDVYFYLGAGRAGGVDVDSAARIHYSKARELDSSSTAALYHLVVLAMRRERPAVARSMASQYARAAAPDSHLVAAALLGAECRAGADSTRDWVGTAQSSPSAVMLMGKILVGGAADLSCAAKAFHALLNMGGPPSVFLYSGMVGLNAVAVARGDTVTLRRLLTNRDARALGMDNWRHLDALGDSALTAAVVRSLGSLPGGEQDQIPAQSGPDEVWVRGAVAAMNGDAAATRRAVGLLASRPASRGWNRDIYVRSLQARVALADGDTASAIRGLAAADSTAQFKDVEWQPFASRAADHLLLAQIAFAQRRYQHALQHAERIDHPSRVANLVFLPASLDIRIRAATAVGDLPLADRLRTRRVKLSF